MEASAGINLRCSMTSEMCEAHFWNVKTRSEWQQVRGDGVGGTTQDDI